LRDKEKREVDFLVVVDRKPWFAVEVKAGRDDVSSRLPYFGDRLGIPFLYQIVWDVESSHMRDDVLVLSPADFLGALRMKGALLTGTWGPAAARMESTTAPGLL
jgi:hypothetical protein